MYTTKNKFTEAAMKRIISLILLIASFTAFAQTTEAEDALKAKLKATDSGWKTGGVVNVNFSQAAFSTKFDDPDFTCRNFRQLF
jgi:hypothetical protein